MAIKFAAIDIGSNSILLTIVEAQLPPLEPLIDEANVTGLAKGLSQGADISAERAKTAEEVLRKYRAIVDAQKITHFKVVGTEAFRKAKNGNEIKERFEKILRTEIEIITGDREAELSFWSVQNEAKDPAAKKIVFDIGGASTELCLRDATGIKNKVSLKVGSVLLTEKFNLQKKSNPEQAKAYVEELLKEIEWLKEETKTIGVGVAGTVTTLLSMEKQLEVYDRKKVHNEFISSDRIDHWLRTLLALDAEDRAKEIKGLTQDRADIIAGGILILSAIVEYLKWPGIYCSDTGVRYGLIAEMIKMGSGDGMGSGHLSAR